MEEVRNPVGVLEEDGRVVEQRVKAIFLVVHVKANQQIRIVRHDVGSVNQLVQNLLFRLTADHVDNDADSHVAAVVVQQLLHELHRAATIHGLTVSVGKVPIQPPLDMRDSVGSPQVQPRVQVCFDDGGVGEANVRDAQLGVEKVPQDCFVACLHGIHGKKHLPRVTTGTRGTVRPAGSARRLLCKVQPLHNRLQQGEVVLHGRSGSSGRRSTSSSLVRLTDSLARVNG
mmetsp:Transcript_7999/g.25565  ORF Transcript_7999/g.25565 Transcript_7999/m.25565 type:complete len:229 (-) Transcript_7999:443-1129(-)